MKIQIFKVGFFLLLLLNIVLLVLLFQGRPNPRRIVNIREKISERLRLDQKQNDQLMDLAFEHREKITVLNKKQRVLIIEFFGEMAKEDESVHLKDKLLDEIRVLHGEKVSVTYNHFKDIQALCNEDQLSAFQEMFGELIPVLSGYDHSQGPPPGP
ncbi:MAG: hypothetical protein AAF600_03315 [Bacteroidota bacterium]